MTLATTALVIGRGAFQVSIPDIRIARGERLAVLGPNGSGKSTLLKTLAGLAPPVAGRVEADGSDVHRAADRVRASLAAYAPPPGDVDAPLDVLTMVRLGGAARGLGSQEEALAALRRLGADALAGRPFDRLSSGERQLVTLARLLVQDSRVCLLDEPASSLDPARRDTVASLIDDLAREGRIVLVATHDLSLVRSVDGVVWMAQSAAEVSRNAGDPDAWKTRYR